MYGDKGKLTEAEELFVKVVDAKTQVLGPNHPDTLTGMHNLAST